MDDFTNRVARVVEPLIRTTAKMSLYAESTWKRAVRIVQRLDDCGLLAPDLSRVSRVTLIGYPHGRIFETWQASEVDFHLQDDGRTLKIFYREVGA